MRKHRRIVVVIDDRRYVIEKERRELGQVVYSLATHLPIAHEVLGGEIQYDVTQVDSRERAAASLETRKAVSFVLHLLSPFVGFLWSATKTHIHERWHLHPIIATRRSYWVQLVLGAWFFFWWGPQWYWWLLFPVDAVLRFHSILVDELTPWGYFEWTVGFFRKRD